MKSTSIPPQIGEKAPLFTLLNQDSVPTNLADSQSKYIIIYFYPKALTPGCTTQACNLRDRWGEFEKGAVAVFGVSPDAPKLLAKFKKEKDLPFDLLSDSEHEMAAAYDTWKKKSMYGREYMGMMRDTFILDPQGVVIGVLHKVTPSEHVEQVLEVIRQHSSQNI